MSTPLGFVLVDKPPGPTSHDVVDVVRRAVGVRRVGHAGTLDPPASGLVVCGVGSATRLLRFVQRQPKVYVTEARLGVTTSTHDADGEIVQTASVDVEGTEIRGVLERFTGDITQVPPAVSAIKIDGERAYKRAARGEEVTLEARPVTVHELELVDADPPDFTLRVRCSTGTYIRSLVRDIGEALGTGAHVRTLRRLAIGSLNVDDAVPLDAVVSESILSIEACLGDLGLLEVDAETAERLRNGQRPSWSGGDCERLAVAPDGAVGVVEASDGILRPVVILPPEGSR